MVGREPEPQVFFLRLTVLHVAILFCEMPYASLSKAIKNITYSLQSYQFGIQIESFSK